MIPSKIKALTFDVFGTVVDYYGTIVREGALLNQQHGLAVDWGKLAAAWRARYRPGLDRVMGRELPWMTVDALHRQALDALIEEFGLSALNEAEREQLNRVWHRCAPWPDALAGLNRLRPRFILATLSNGNVALLVNMARHSQLPWDCIISTELFRSYKPDPQVYLGAAELLGLRPDQVMMVAAHQYDLRAAQACGLKTAFVPRPLEFGPGAQPDLSPDPGFDIVATDFVDLADQLGA